jgi:hypothetical protein
MLWVVMKDGNVTIAVQCTKCYAILQHVTQCHKCPEKDATQEDTKEVEEFLNKIDAIYVTIGN